MHAIKNEHRTYVLNTREGNMVAGAIMSHMKALQELIDSTEDKGRQLDLQEKLSEYRELYNNFD